MCGRFYVDDETAREIEKVIRQVNDRVNGVPTGDIRPTNPAAVLFFFGKRISESND